MQPSFRLYVHVSDHPCTYLIYTIQPLSLHTNLRCPVHVSCKSVSKSAENLFRCGHVQAIEVATVDASLYIKSNCLPETRKDWVYCIEMQLNKITCDVVSAYALADFFRVKSTSLPELLTCIDQLQQWNRPRTRKVELYP